MAPEVRFLGLFMIPAAGLFMSFMEDSLAWRLALWAGAVCALTLQLMTLAADGSRLWRIEGMPFDRGKTKAPGGAGATRRGLAFSAGLFAPAAAAAYWSHRFDAVWVAEFDSWARLAGLAVLGGLAFPAIFILLPKWREARLYRRLKRKVDNAEQFDKTGVAWCAHCQGLVTVKTVQVAPGPKMLVHLCPACESPLILEEGAARLLLDVMQQKLPQAKDWTEEKKEEIIQGLREKPDFEPRQRAKAEPEKPCALCGKPTWKWCPGCQSYVCRHCEEVFLEDLADSHLPQDHRTSKPS